MAACMQKMTVASRAMEPTLKQGTEVHVETLFDATVQAQRWDVVVFAAPKVEELRQNLGKEKLRERGDQVEDGLAAVVNAAANIYRDKQILVRPHMFYIKRVVGLPGERIQFVANTIQINGQELEVPAHVCTEYRFEDVERFSFGGTEFIVPADGLFVLSDNASDAIDSRHIGAIPQDFVVGRVVLE